MRLLDYPGVAGLLRMTGALQVLERLPRKRGLIVLNYHRVGDPAGNPFDDATFSATAAAFRAQMSYVKDRFATPPAATILESFSRGRFDAPTALVTFDDGYRDNHTIAFPVLRELNVPACFFVVSGMLDRPRLPWWDGVAYAIKQTQVDRLILEYPTRLEFDLRSTARRLITWRILRAYKDASSIDDARFFDELGLRTGVVIDPEQLGRGLFMSWDDAREMAAAGMTIGSHTVTHPVLAALPEAAQRRELIESRDRIGHMVGVSPELFAYPVGGPGAFTEVTKRAAREAGYRAAFCYYGSLNLPATTDMYAIARLAVEHDQTPAQFRLRLATAAIGGR
ncbi:MAG TPA: polysaccharide deacetylase family protein [Vicinamibacterales bacterium]|jgi:peptidoglycan/xylan/chitin deacetylase (PgdA/CDA1 family)